MGPISYGVAGRCSRLGLAVALAFVVLRALPNLTYPMGNDQATYGLIGDALLELGQYGRAHSRRHTQFVPAPLRRVRPESPCG